MGLWARDVKTLDTVHSVRVSTLVARIQALERRIKAEWRFWTQMMRKAVGENVPGKDCWSVRVRLGVVLRLVDELGGRFMGPFGNCEELVVRRGREG